MIDERQTEEIRRDFPLLSGDFAYLDNSATTQRPMSVIKAVENFYTSCNANPMRGLYDLSIRATDSYENARSSAARFINAAPDEIVFTRNATESLNLAAYSYAMANVSAGDEIIVGISEHHSNMLPWQMVAKAKGARLLYLECDSEGRYSLESLEALLSDRTKIVALAQVSNVIGRENDIRAFARAAHSRNAVFVCDGAQSVPHMTVDVKALDVDFLAFSGHKMLAPMGIGVLYGKKALLEEMPPFLYGGEMIEYVTREGATWAEVPHKFEAGTVNAADAAGLGAAIEYIEAIGLDNTAEREDYLTRLMMEGMKGIPHVHIIGSSDPSEHHGIVTFTVDGVHPHDIAAIMDSDRVCIRAGHHCAQPLHKALGIMSTARASISFYNTEADISRFINSLSTLRRRMGYAE